MSVVNSPILLLRDFPEEFSRAEFETSMTKLVQEFNVETYVEGQTEAGRKIEIESL